MIYGTPEMHINVSCDRCDYKLVQIMRAKNNFLLVKGKPKPDLLIILLSTGNEKLLLA